VPKLLTFNGVESAFYTIGEVAFKLGRQSQTVRKWETTGIIPTSGIRNQAGRRLYSQEMLDVLIAAAKKYDIRQGYEIQNGFKADIRDGFKKALEKIQGDKADD
jgi:hypothetical protein